MAKVGNVWRIPILVAALVVPLVAGLLVSWWLTRESIGSELQALAAANARRVVAIVNVGRSSLAQLADELDGDCGPADQQRLQRAGFGNLYYREAGLVSDGRLLCTSFGKLEEPVLIPLDYRRREAIFVDGPFELLDPQPTLMGGRSLIARFDLAPKVPDHYVNLLVSLDEFSDLVRYFGTIDGAVYLIDHAHVAPLQIAGPHLPLLDPVHERIGFEADGSVLAVAHATPYPLATVVRMSAANVLDRWQEQAGPAVVFSSLLTALGLLLIRRWLPVGEDVVEQLQRAITRRELEVHYQPVVDARSGRVLGVEALVRWRHPERGLLFPDAFLDIADRHGLIGALTGFVLEEAGHAIRRLRTIPVAVNIAPQLLRHQRLTELVDRSFGPAARLDRLTLEITERELIEYADSPALESVRSLARRGARISLDDFGTGFSGLSHLRYLHPQQIKIDRSFIRALGSEAVTAALVDAVVTMTDTLGVDLVAEGVETEAQRDLLLLRGIHAQQGWLYAKAMPLADLLRYLAAAGFALEPDPARSGATVDG